MPNSEGSAKQPVCLHIEELAPDVRDSLISLSLSVESQKTQVFLVSGNEKQKVPRECHDAVSVMVHQFQLYRGSAKALMALPESDDVKEDIDFHLAVAMYLTNVLAKFIDELRADAPSPRAKWRSCYLDFHFAMALVNNSFTKEQQATALQKIDRTWNDFQQKKTYSPVQQLDLAKMHDTFCKDGADVCGSSRTHQRSIDEMIAQVIEPHTAHKRAEANDIQQKKTLRFEDLTLADVKTSAVGKARKTGKDSRNFNTQGHTAADEEQRTHRPNRSVKTTISLGSSISATNTADKEHDSNDVQNNELQESTKKTRNKRLFQPRTKKAVIPEMMIQPENDNCSDMDDTVLAEADNPCETKVVRKKICKSTKGGRRTKNATKNEKMKSKSNETLESEVQRGALEGSDLEDDGIQEVAKNVEKDGKKIHKYATQDKKAKSKEEIESEDDRHSGVDMTVAPESNADAVDYDDVKFPRDFDDQDEYIKKVFKEGNSHVFLKLAAWISRRFRELAGIDNDDDLNGLVVPRHPGWFTFDNHDHFLEALGMERIYAATTHMDTHPEYLACVFRQLGELESTKEMGSSHPRLRPLPSPPTPVASMMSAHVLPWLLPLVRSTDDHTDSESEGDDCDINVTHTCNGTDIAKEGQGSLKRKRTSQAGPVVAAKRVRRGNRPMSPAMTSTETPASNGVTLATNGTLAMDSGAITRPVPSPSPISSSVSDVTQALLSEEGSGSTSEPADTEEATTNTDGDSTNENDPPEKEEAMTDIIKGAAGILSEPVYGSGFKAVKDDSGSEPTSPETAASDSDAGTTISDVVSASPLTPTTHSEESQWISNSEMTSASDPSHPSKKDEDDWYAEMLNQSS